MLADIQKRAVSFVSNNASALLTAGGVVGTTATGILAWRGGYKTGQKVVFAENKVENVTTLSKTEKVKLAVVDAVPPTISGGATIAAIILSNRMSAQKAAALAAAYGISQKQLDEYKAKLEEKLGVKKAEAIRDDIQQDRVNARPASKEVIIIGNGEVLCYDSYSGRYFKSTVEHVRRAANVVNDEILKTNECSLEMFYDELEIPQTQFSNEVGWNLNHSCQVDFSAVLSDDNEPCIAIEFRNLPMYDYGVKY